MELRPLLRAAVLPADFEDYCKTFDLEATLIALEDEQATLETLRQEIVRTECCLEMPLVLDAAFPRFVRELAQRPHTDLAALLLSELIAGNKNIENWFRADAGLLGILTPEETHTLAANLRNLFQRGFLGSRRGRKRRRGGLVGVIKGFLSGLFALSPSDEEILFLLDDLLRDATRNGEGLALGR